MYELRYSLKKSKNEGDIPSFSKIINLKFKKICSENQKTMK